MKLKQSPSATQLSLQTIFGSPTPTACCILGGYELFFKTLTSALSLLRGLGLASCVYAAGVSAQTLNITPITWGVIGLDSNNVTVGPDTFPIGARVCNIAGTGGIAATNVTANFTFGAGNAAGVAAINLAPSSTSSINFGTLTSGTVPPSQYQIRDIPANCADFYFNVLITRATASYDQTRQFVITASSTNAAAVSTPSPREIYAERLVSQARNSVNQISGPTTVFVGDRVTYNFLTQTAPGGYEQVKNFISWPNTIFRVVNAASTYQSPTGGVNSTVYADACGWQSDPSLVNYRSCVGPVNSLSGKAGGNISATFVLGCTVTATGQ